MPILNVIPSKHIFNALSRDISIKLAISDLIDNSIDNWMVNKLKRQLKIVIEVSEKSIRIEDNAGGMDKESLSLLFLLGGTNRTGKTGVKGIYGVGAQRAFFTLGKDIVIKTKRQGKDGLKVILDDTWFTPDKIKETWSIEYAIDNSIKSGSTSIEITSLKKEMDVQSVRDLKREISLKHINELKSGKIEILFNDEAISETEFWQWAINEYAPPSKYVTELEVPKTKRILNLEITAGIMTQSWGEDEYGITFIANGRVIFQNNLSSDVGFKKGHLGGRHPTINRFKAIVTVSGDNRDIPWNSPKNDLDVNHKMYKTIFGLTEQASYQYTSFLRKHYRVTSKLFNVQAVPDDIIIINLSNGMGFKRVTKDYEEPISTFRIGFEVNEDDYIELIKYYGLPEFPRKDVGLFLFNRAINEVRGDA